MEPDKDQAAQRPESPRIERFTVMKFINKLERTRLCLTLSAAALLIAGCGGNVKYPRYYTLNIPPALKPSPEGTHLPAGVAVRRFETPGYLRQGRIVYREAPETVDFYEYHRWAAEPGPTVTSAMIDRLRSARLFKLVTPYDSQEKPDYVITGRLERLDEIDYGGKVRVEAKISVALIDMRNGITLWAGEEAATSNVETSTVNAVVDAMSDAIQLSIDGLVANMGKQLLGAEVASTP
jgi:uncharacterized lipoprotein YmbA